MSDSYFVKITDKNKTHAHLLASSKEVLLASKIQLRLRELVQAKDDLKETLYRQIADVSETIHALRDSLPHQELLEEEATRRKTLPPAEHGHEVEKPHSFSLPASDVDKLDKALQAIEAKLAKLK